MRRRDLLTGGTAALLGSSAWLYPKSAASTIDASYLARYGALGAKHFDPWGSGIVGDRPMFKVLEIFLYGGLSPWETFYLDPTTSGGAACDPGCAAANDPALTQWGTYRCQFEALANADTQITPGNPVGARRPAGTPLTKEFADGIHLGPATWPLWKPGIFERLRPIIMKHDLTPHEAAVPYSLTGTRLGLPGMAGTGTAVTKHRMDTTGGAPADPIPVAYVVKPAFDTKSDNVLAATATGLLESAYKPLLIEWAELGPPNLDILNRMPTAAQDALLDYYRRQYKGRLTWPGASERVRSPAFSDYEAMLSQYSGLSQIAGALGGYTPTPGLVGGGEPALCVQSNTPRAPTPDTDPTRHALNFAGHLLNLPFTTYVCVVDVGRQNNGGAGYDTHDNHAQGQYRNLASTLEVLGRMLDPDPAVPGPKIDQQTLVVLTTEFGRGPQRETGRTGRPHYPYAYANMMILPNNPVWSLPTPRIVGSIDSASQVQSFGGRIGAITPTDLRGALLLALGVDPLAQGLFGVGDFSTNISKGLRNEQLVLDNLVKEVFGYAGRV